MHMLYHHVMKINRQQYGGLIFSGQDETITLSQNVGQ
jgi:hypothetical protein